MNRSSLRAEEEWESDDIEWFAITPREPTIFELWILLRLFMRYSGGTIALSHDLEHLYFFSLPEPVLSYILWREVRTWD